ncbi:MAG TPA: protease inhibitor Inh/omp19 family protein [Xanthobacteraceae bacterium]|nr:protease inhibitor Inh/omp19 family protein [Xanthobacteraceae bacterium]
MCIRVAAVSAVAALLLAGCSTVIDGFGSSPAPTADGSAITPAPTGSVESSAVAAAQPAFGAGAASAGDAVTPRRASDTLAINAPAPAAPGGVAFAEPGAARTQLAGDWTFGWDDGQKTCPVKLSTEHGLSGFAASADVTCPNDIFMTKGWDLWGSEIVLQNHVGKVTARLKTAGSGRYEGVVTSDGGRVTLVR